MGTAAGDLSGTYPSPIIGANKVTYGKMQQVSTGARLLGGPTTGTTAGNVAEISLGTGLGFVAGQLTNTAIPTVSATGTNTFTGANTFQGNVVVGNEATDTLSVNAAITTNGTVILGSTNNAANAITVVGPLKITSGSPVAGKFLTTDNLGNASWAEPTNTSLPTVAHFIYSQYFFRSIVVIDTNPGATNNTVAQGATVNVPLSTLTVGAVNKWRISTGSTNGSRQVNLVLAAGQSCYFTAPSATVTYQAAVGNPLIDPTTAFNTALATATSSLGAAWSIGLPTLHTGPKTVTVWIASGNGTGFDGWFSAYRIS